MNFCNSFSCFAVPSGRRGITRKRQYTVDFSGECLPVELINFPLSPSHDFSFPIKLFVHVKKRSLCSCHESVETKDELLQG